MGQSGVVGFGFRLRACVDEAGELSIPRRHIFGGCSKPQERMSTGIEDGVQSLLLLLPPEGVSVICRQIC